MRFLMQVQIQYRLHVSGSILNLDRQVAVTFTADQFRGIYRGKAYQEPDYAEVLKRAKYDGCDKIMLTALSCVIELRRTEFSIG